MTKTRCLAASILALLYDIAQVKHTANLSTWLFQVARNCCVDELRRRKRHAIQFSQLESGEVDNEFSFLNEIPDAVPLWMS